MDIALGERNGATVEAFFRASRSPRIRAALPLQARTLEEALEDYRRSLLPGARSFGRTILADGRYVGDVWCFAIDPTDDPQAMVSYCVLDDALLCRGVATAALRLFLPEAARKYGIRRFGAHTYAWNAASRRVLEHNGFSLAETFTEDGVESCFYYIEL